MHPEKMHRVLAAVLNVQINASKEAGDPIDLDAVSDAETTVQLLLAAQTMNPDLITTPVIETAKNRAHVLRLTHAMLEFGVGGELGAELFGIRERFGGIEARLGGVETRLARMEAGIENSKIMTFNRSHSSSLRPLKKMIEGNGHELALNICGNAPLPAEAQGYYPNAGVGHSPAQWNPNIQGYSDLDILLVVIFYNHDFDIEEGDHIGTKRQKFRMWLKGEEFEDFE